MSRAAGDLQRYASMSLWLVIQYKGKGTQSVLPHKATVDSFHDPSGQTWSDLIGHQWPNPHKSEYRSWIESTQGIEVKFESSPC